MANIGLVLGGLAEGYQQQQRQQQEQQYRQFLMQQAQLQAAQQARQELQQQQGLGAAWSASGQLRGGGMGGGGPPDTMVQPQQPQQQPLPQAPSYGPSGGMPTDAQLGLARQAIARGYPPAAAAGMAGSMTGESGANLDPYALNPKSGALGEAQWMGPRKAALMQQPNPYSRDTQNNFLFSELRGPEASTGQRLMGATDPGQAAKDFTTGFERPGNVDMSGRVKASQAIFAQIVPEAKQISQSVTQAVPPQQWGRSSIEDLHKAVEQANPDATPQVKMLALMQLQKLMAPEQKAELQAWAMQNKAELQLAMKEFSTQQSERLAEFKQGLKPDQGEKGWQILQTPQGAMRVNPNTGQTAQLDLPAGTTKMGTTAQGGAAPQPDPQKDTMAQGIANYQIAPLSGWALRTPWGKQTMENVLALNPQYAAPDYAARVSGTRAFTSGKQSDTIRSMDVAVSHLDTVDKLGEALANKDLYQLNKLGNLLKTQTGAEGPVDFNFAKTIVVDEIVKATAGGVLTGQERQSLARQLDAASSPEQLSGVISTAKALMAGQLGGLRRQFEGATGKGDEAFDKKLAPETQKALTGKSGGTGGYSSADDVLKAIDSGALSREDGKKILIDQFGYSAKTAR